MTCIKICVTAAAFVLVGACKPRAYNSQANDVASIGSNQEIIAEIKCGAVENESITFVLTKNAQGGRAKLTQTTLKKPFPGGSIFEANMKSFVTNEDPTKRITTFEFLPEQQTCTIPEQGDRGVPCPILQKVALTEVTKPSKVTQNVEVILDPGERPETLKYENCSVDMRKEPHLDESGKHYTCGPSAYKDRGDGVTVKIKGWRPDGTGCL
jgi:hypothetical protein